MWPLLYLSRQAILFPSLHERFDDLPGAFCPGGKILQTSGRKKVEGGCGYGLGRSEFPNRFIEACLPDLVEVTFEALDESRILERLPEAGADASVDGVHRNRDGFEVRVVIAQPLIVFQGHFAGCTRFRCEEEFQ